MNQKQVKKMRRIIHAESDRIINTEKQVIKNMFYALNHLPLHKRIAWAWRILWGRA